MVFSGDSSVGKTRTKRALPCFSLVFCASQTRTKPALRCGDGKARQTGAKLALPCYFLFMCGDDKARQKNLLCLQLWLCVAMAR